MQAYPENPSVHAEEERYLRQIRAVAPRDQQVSELERELEFRGVLVERLVDLGVTAETAPAFEALPLAMVAWADGSVDPEERWRVLGVATAFGLELGRPAHAQIELWLRRPPRAEWIEAWHEYAAVALRRPEASPRAERLLEGMREVAEACGGVLGMGSVSAAEREVIDRVREALGANEGGRT